MIMHLQMDLFEALMSAVLLLLLLLQPGTILSKNSPPRPRPPPTITATCHTLFNRLKLFIDCVFANHHCDILGGVVTVSSADKWVQSFVVPWLWI